MNVSKRSAKKNQIKKSIITMNNKTIHELRDIAKEQNLPGYYMLRMSDLIALLSKKMTKEMPTPSPRNKNYKRRPVRILKMIPNHQKMDKLEE